MLRQTTSLVLVCLLAAVAACNVAPTPKPVATSSGPTPALPPVAGDPQDLILHLEDLPGGFRLAGQEQPGANEYSVIYVRPDALAEDNPSQISLLGIIANLSIHTDASVATAQFTAQGGLDQASVEKAVREASQGATDVAVQPYDVQLEGTDEVIAFRVDYAIGATRLVEYRYRVRVSNAIANLIITARTPGTGSDASAFREAAHAIAAQQVTRLNQARH